MALISITVRVPQETRDELASRAAGHAMPLPEYLREVLNAVVSMPEGNGDDGGERLGEEESELLDGLDNPDTRTVQEKMAALMVRIRGVQS